MVAIPAGSPQGACYISGADLRPGDIVAPVSRFCTNFELLHKVRPGGHVWKVRMHSHPRPVDAQRSIDPHQLYLVVNRPAHTAISQVDVHLDALAEHDVVRNIGVIVDIRAPFWARHNGQLRPVRRALVRRVDGRTEPYTFVSTDVTMYTVKGGPKIGRARADALTVIFQGGRFVWRGEI